MEPHNRARDTTTTTSSTLHLSYRETKNTQGRFFKLKSRLVTKSITTRANYDPVVGGYPNNQVVDEQAVEVSTTAASRRMSKRAKMPGLEHHGPKSKCEEVEDSEDDMRDDDEKEDEDEAGDGKDDEMHDDSSDHSFEDGASSESNSDDDDDDDTANEGQGQEPESDSEDLESEIRGLRNENSAQLVKIPPKDEKFFKVYLHLHLLPITDYFTLDFRPYTPSKLARSVEIWGDVYGFPAVTIPMLEMRGWADDDSAQGKLNHFDTTRMSELTLRLLMQIIEMLHEYMNSKVQWSVIAMKECPGEEGNVVFTLQQASGFPIVRPTLSEEDMQALPTAGIVREVLLLSKEPERCDNGTVRPQPSTRNQSLKKWALGPQPPTRNQSPPKRIPGPRA